jgi:hypothetical protein
MINVILGREPLDARRIPGNTVTTTKSVIVGFVKLK